MITLYIQPIARTHRVTRVHIRFLFEQHLCYFEFLILDCSKKWRATVLRKHQRRRAVDGVHSYHMIPLQPQTLCHPVNHYMYRIRCYVNERNPHSEPTCSFFSQSGCMPASSRNFTSCMDINMYVGNEMRQVV